MIITWYITDKSNNKDKNKLATIVEIKNLWKYVTAGNQPQSTLRGIHVTSLMQYLYRITNSAILK
jgi:hypothetical protein